MDEGKAGPLGLASQRHVEKIKRVYDDRMSHLDNAKRALERQARSGKRTGPTADDMLQAIKEIIAHLQELERTPAVTVNAPTK